MALARLCLAVLAVLAATRASAGALIEGTSSDRSDGPQRFLVDGQHVRIESKGDQHGVIFDAAEKRMIQLDGATRSYTEITQADMEKLRAFMAERSGTGSASAPKHAATTRRYEKTGRTDSALGKSCDVYRAMHGDAESHEELCVAPFGTFGVERSDFEGFRALGAYADAFVGRQQQRGDWTDLPGVPLIGWKTAGGKRQESFRATKVEKRSFAPSDFAVPAGWTKKPGPAEQLEMLELRQTQKGRK